MKCFSFELIVFVTEPQPKSEVVEPPPSQPPEKATRSSSFEKKHEAYKPSSMFARLRQAASSFIAADEKPVKETAKEAPPSEPPVALQEPQETVSRESEENSLDAFLDIGDPILFDLPSPVSEQVVASASVSYAHRRQKDSKLNDFFFLSLFGHWGGV